jgi:hypothetical protein
MGCGPSNPENAQALEAIPDISLRSFAPRPSDSADLPLMTSFGFSDSPNLSKPRPPPSTFPVEMIDHTTVPSAPPPDAEQRQHRFVEHFSLLGADTFQSVRMLSFSRVAVPDLTIQASHDIEGHCRFMDQVLESLGKPFERIRVVDQRPLAISIA